MEKISEDLQNTESSTQDEVSEEDSIELTFADLETEAGVAGLSRRC